MTKVPPSDVVPLFDIDTVCWCVYNGDQPSKVTMEGGRVCFWFPESVALGREAQLAADTAVVSVPRWAAVVKSVHSRWLRPEAKLALRAQGILGENARRV